ncbi:MAG: CRISPR-associated endonuclease Cas1 [Candidatus Nanopelagicales bacterium]|nr:CRISPR-associated endonuclease Cas1 [Candidatus Nanopelagicales bacterium]
MSDPIPISLVAHAVFCPRRAWLEANGETADSLAMTVGVINHATVDDPDRSRRSVLRAVEVRSDELGVRGRCDTIEVDDGGSLTVVEHKSTPIRRRATVPPQTRVQLTLQVLALRHMGYRVAAQAVYFSEHQKRVEIELDDTDEESARQAIKDTEQVLASVVAPAPLSDDRRCQYCSHVSVCLPDENNEKPALRRITVADPDTQVLHITTQGSRASLRRGTVRIEAKGKEIGTVPIARVQAVVLHGNVDLSGGLIRELLWGSIPVLWCSSSGRLVGWASPADSPNGRTRNRQHVASANGRLDIAAQMVATKIGNQATLLRRLGRDSVTVTALRDLSRRATKQHSLDELLGIEGDAAARYFRAFPTMLTDEVKRQGLALLGRSGRPARDPSNSLLNYAYSLLLADAVKAILACGLDPHAGFLHSSGRNKPALALDLVEEFRAPIADSVVIRLLNNGELAASDFTDTLGTTRLTTRARRALVTSYERRLTTQFRHPAFGYRLTWRRAIEVQARMLLGVLDGTHARYRGIRIR